MRINLKHKRKCISCGILKSKDELIKITKEYSSESIVVQPNSQTFGRSAYLCYNQECINAALKKDRLKRALRYKGSAELKGLFDGQFKSK